MKKKLVVLTGAGISQESGIPTFRDADGLWEGYDVMDVASPEGWARDPEMVLDFYNQRRKQVLAVNPNPGHDIIAGLEDHFDVTVITQNIDDLHERAGSSNILHLHGSIFESRSHSDPDRIYKVGGEELNWGDNDEFGNQLRPNVVWFGEMVPLMEVATQEVEKAEVFIVVGTSLAVYPAAGLVEYVADAVPKYVVDPNIPGIRKTPNLHLVSKKASIGLKIVKEAILDS